MRKSRIADVFWRLVSFFTVLFTVLLLIAWGILFLDPMIYYPQYGVIFILTATFLLSISFYGHRRYKKQFRTEICISPTLCKRFFIGFIFVGTAVTYPLAQVCLGEYQQVYFPSQYDDNIGDQFIPNYTGAIYNSLPNAPSAHCSSIAYLPNGELFTVWFAGTGEKHTDVAIYGSHCTPEMTDAGGDYNLTWETPVVVADTPEKSEGSPVLYLCPNGILILFFQTVRPTGPLFPDGTGPIIEAGWSVAKIKMQFSNDYGYTWSDPTYLRDDYFWVLRDHALLTNDNHVLLPFHREALQYQALFYRNDDPNLGGNWKVTGRLRTPHGCLEPSLTQLDNGRILCLLRTLDDRIYRSHSDDGGYTWTRPVAMRFPNPSSQTKIMKLRDGRLVLLCNPHTEIRGVFSIIVGDPTGEFWSDPEWIFYDPGQSFSYPSMVQLPDDTVVFTYSHNRGRIGYGRFNMTLLEDFVYVE